MNKELTDLLGTDFTFGTIVEYKAEQSRSFFEASFEMLKRRLEGLPLVRREAGFGVEWQRGTINEVSLDRKGLSIGTDSHVRFPKIDPDQLIVSKEGGVFYLGIPFVANYALAPAGVTIPSKPSYDRHIAGRMTLRTA